eukprot:5096646-Ditylum_brightwellii.AAC.1
MQSKAEKYFGDGVVLIYYTLCKYTGSANSVIVNHLQQLNGLPAKTLKCAGGKDDQAPEKLIEALTTSPITEFNSDICSH